MKNSPTLPQNGAHDSMPCGFFGRVGKKRPVRTPFASAQPLQATSTFIDPARRTDARSIKATTAKKGLSATSASKKKQILLLQGPVGPFFSELHSSLEAAGLGVKRVVFNSGDKLFAPERACVRFTGTLKEWDTWLRCEVTQNRPDCIILFGSSRPAHKVAREIATLFEIEVVSLEEGYLRSGFVTAEPLGNNQHSLLTQWKPGRHLASDINEPPSALPLGSTFLTMSLWGTIYYLARELFSQRSDEHLFHRRKERALVLSWRWCAHMARRVATKITEIPTKRALHKRPGYILIPLQVSHDSQLVEAARGWNTQKLVNAGLQALLETDTDQRVVFKLHPLERGNGAIKRFIHQRAKALGIKRAQYKILNSGRIGDLAAHSSGMIVINSTSAFSALHNAVPILVLGDAVFRHDDIVTIGNSEQDVTDFFKMRRAKCPEVIDEFIETLKIQSLIPGDFYVAAGRKIAIENVIRKLEELPVAYPASREANA